MVLIRYEFAKNEFVTCLDCVTLETVSTETGTKDYIAVGTTINRGEDLAEVYGLARILGLAGDELARLVATVLRAVLVTVLSSVLVTVLAAVVAVGAMEVAKSMRVNIPVNSLGPF